jgi:hypothetical protein
MVTPRVMQHLHGVLHGHSDVGSPGDARVHTSEKFAFTANAPMEKVAPLFGAEKERVWAANWNPKFIHPLPATDEEGMVFTVAHGHMEAAWVNTEFDMKDGRIQYVYMIPDTMITVITLRLAPQNKQTRVEVEYTRTALSADADEHVRHMADGDRKAGADWDRWVNGYLAKDGSP